MSTIELANKYFDIPITFLEDKNLSVIPEKMVQDLELQDIKVGNEERQSLYTKVFNPTSTMGKIILPQWCNYYTDDVKHLNDTKNLIKTYKNVRFNVENAPQQPTIVDGFIDKWKEIKGSSEFRSKYYYFDWKEKERTRGVSVLSPV